MKVPRSRRADPSQGAGVRGGREVPALAHEAADQGTRSPARSRWRSRRRTRYYKTDREAALAYAAAVNEEVKDLFAAGADVVQLDEPYMQARFQKAEEYGVEALNRAVEGVTGKTCVHICFGYAALIHHRPGQYQFLPQFAKSNDHTDLDRDRAVESGLLGAEPAAGQGNPARRDRPVDVEGGDGRAR